MTNNTAPQFTICICKNCGGKIEFDSCHVGEVVNCPHCQEQITLESNWAGNELNIELTLSSGQLIKVKSIKLYNQQQLVAINVKKAKIVSLSGGVSTGLGSIGSFTWVAASSLAIGFVESILSGSARIEAEKLLKELSDDEIKLRETSHFFPVNQIRLIGLPFPNAWSSRKEVTTFIKRYSKEPANKPPPLINVVLDFVHDGSEFITVINAEDKVISVRWDSVTSHSLS
jgi:hypothetical protein